MDLPLLDEARVAVAGDWHANVNWMQIAIRQLAKEAPDVRTILHTGDFGIWPGSKGMRYLELVDKACSAAGIARVLVTPGNHDDWDQLDARFAAFPDRPVRFSDSVWVLPRGLRFSLGSRTFLAFGGAASIDFASRQVGKDWWLTETPTDHDVAASSTGGRVDVLLTHETVDGGVAAVEKLLRSNPRGWSAEALSYSASSRERVTKLWNTLTPKILIHGHLHVPGEIMLSDGRRVYSLGSDGDPRNIGFLTLTDLSWSWASELEAKPRARRTLNIEHTYLTRPMQG